MLRTRLRGGLAYVIAAALGFAAAFLVVAFAIFPGDGGIEQVTVPSVTGLPVNEAIRRLERIGLRGREAESRLSGAAPKGTILEQTPRAGEVERSGTTISLVVSGGQEMGTVPQVAGMSRREAERLLEEAGFAIGAITQRASDTTRGTVLETTPAGGEELALPGPVRLTLSGGPSAIVIPDVTGRSYPAARDALQALGLDVRRTSLDSASTAPAGTVISQNPTAGRTVPAGSPVGLVLSAGMGMVMPPQP